MKNSVPLTYSPVGQKDFPWAPTKVSPVDQDPDHPASGARKNTFYLNSDGSARKSAVAPSTAGGDRLERTWMELNIAGTDEMALPVHQNGASLFGDK